MSIFSKQSAWTNYLNSLIKESNPFTATRKENDDSLLRAERKNDDVEAAEKEKEEAMAESDAHFEKVEAEADNRLSFGDSEKKETANKSNALYELLLDFTKKQESRYDNLVAELRGGNYLDSDAAKSILASYEEKGKSAAGHALAEAAGANGGNPDTYAAAQGNRQRLAFLDAGHEAARSYYGEQLERLLSAVRASSSDMGDLYGAVQNNIDEAGARADNDLSIGADLLKILSDAKEGREERAQKALSEERERAAEAAAVSPMEIDSEYKMLLAEKQNGLPKYTETEALNILWDKYPAMRNYIKSKYKSVLSPEFVFEE